MLYGLLLCVVCCVCACGVECVCGLLLVPSVKLSAFVCEFSVCCYLIVCFVYDVLCGVVWFVCVCLSLCVWLFVLGMKCLAAVFVSYCVTMSDDAWSVYLCFFCFVCVMCCWRLFNRA